MPTDFVFRLSMYLTLALSCASLGYAERRHLPEVPFIAAAVVVAMAVLFRLETRVRLLSIPDANRLGLAVGLVYTGWAAVRVVRVFRQTGPPDLEWQFLLIALVGPLLMLTMPAKLARREKHAGDYWWLHGAALATAGLSAAMVEDTLCFALVALYAACGLWSLALLHLRLAAGEVPPIPGRPAAHVAGVVAVPRTGLVAALALAAVAVALAAPLYLATPRSPAARLEFGKADVHIGYAADQMLNLNQTGELTADDQVAFQVRAEANGQPYTELPPDLRWRGRVLRRYFNGGWEFGESPLPQIETALSWHMTWNGQVVEAVSPILSILADVARETIPVKTTGWTPPRLADNQVTLTFSVPRELLGEFLAEPIVWGAGQNVPIVTATRTGLDGWLWVGDGSFFWDFQGEHHGDPLTYHQIWDPGAQPDLSPPLRLAGGNPQGRISRIVFNPVPRVKDYADGLVEAMVRAEKLPADCRDRISLLPRPEYHARIARAFAEHLATTPDLRYTTKLERTRKDLDPIEEFLFHTKAGHCERFATALVLLLRSQGIPAVFVLGFKGCEPGPDPGGYIIRQSNAHAWVDALVPAEGQAATDPQRRVYHWMSLDPTPSGPAPDQAPRGTTALGEFGSWLRNVFNEYVVNYTPEKRRKALAAIGNWLVRVEVLAVFAAVLAAVVVRRVARRAGGTPAAVVAYPQSVRWFARLQEVLAAHGFTPGPGQTAREFALAVEEELRQRPETAELARVAPDWTDAYYEVRFGGEALAAERLAELDRGLDALDRALTATHTRSEE